MKWCENNTVVDPSLVHIVLSVFVNGFHKNGVNSMCQDIFQDRQGMTWSLEDEHNLNRYKERGWYF
jgi:hypothetical protein